MNDELEYFPVDRHLREHKVSELPEYTHENLREKAAEVREEMEE